MVHGTSHVGGYDVDTALRLLGPADFGDAAPSGSMETLILIIQNIAIVILRVLNYICGDHQWYNNRTAVEIINQFNAQGNTGEPQDAFLYDRVQRLYDALLLRANGNESYAEGINVPLLQHNVLCQTSAEFQAQELKTVEIGPLFWNPRFFKTTQHFIAARIL